MMGSEENAAAIGKLARRPVTMAPITTTPVLSDTTNKNSNGPASDHQQKNETTTPVHYFTTCYKMRKFTDDPIPADLVEKGDVLSSAASTTSSSASQERLSPTSPTSPLNSIVPSFLVSPDTNPIVSTTLVGRSNIQGVKTTPESTDYLGIEIPSFLQPLLGLDFLPLLTPTTTIPESSVVDEIISIEELTDRVFDELDAFCPVSVVSDIVGGGDLSNHGSSIMINNKTSTTAPCSRHLYGTRQIAAGNHEEASIVIDSSTETNVEIEHNEEGGPPRLRETGPHDDIGSKQHQQHHHCHEPPLSSSTGNSMRRKRRPWNKSKSFGMVEGDCTDHQKQDVTREVPPKAETGVRKKLSIRFMKKTHLSKDRLQHETSADRPTPRKRGASWSGEDPLANVKMVEDLTPSISDNSGKDAEAGGAGLDWLQGQLTQLRNEQSNLRLVQAQAVEIQQKSVEISNRVSLLQTELTSLECAIERSQKQLRSELDNLGGTLTELMRLQDSAMKASQAVADTIRRMAEGLPSSSAPNGTRNGTAQNHVSTLGKGLLLQPGNQYYVPLRERAATAPINAEEFLKSNNSDGDDMRLRWYENQYGGTSSVSSSSVTNSSPSLNIDTMPSENDFVFVDHDLAPLLQHLDQLGFDVATDESLGRFIPTSDTKKILKRYKKRDVDKIETKDGPSDNGLSSEWPVQPWHAVHGNDILIWTGDVNHNGVGSDWPVCKTRGLVKTSPRVLLDYIMDSSKVREYNKMSLGREDVHFIQKGVDVTASASPYGIAGECKIVRAVNKPRLLPITIEMMSIMHCKPLETSVAGPGTYLMVYRSVFEDTTERRDLKPTIRSEMLLGAVLLRPYNTDHTVTEMTSITHMYSPGVPEMIARRAAPSAAMNVIRDIQGMFEEK